MNHEKAWLFTIKFPDDSIYLVEYDGKLLAGEFDHKEHQRIHSCIISVLREPIDVEVALSDGEVFRSSLEIALRKEYKDESIMVIRGHVV